MADDLTTIQNRLSAIEARNQRVESDKAWETSSIRKVGIAVLTYAVMVLFMWSLGNEKPHLNAIIPTLGFLLSTFSMSFLKTLWITNRNR